MAATKKKKVGRKTANNVQVKTALSVLRLLNRKPAENLINLLAKEKKPIAVKDIQKRLKMEQSVTSSFLKQLKSFGVVTSIPEGKHRLYALEKLQLQKYQTLAMAFHNLATT